MSSEDKQALVNAVDEDDDKENNSYGKKKNNLMYVSFNFINSIIGSGIIGMPYAIKKAGLGMGIILLIIIALISDYSLVLLVKGGQLSGTSNYQDLVLSSLGKIGFYVLSAIQFIYPFIAMVSYNVIIGDTIPKVFRRLSTHHYSYIENRFFIVFLITLLVTLPLSLYKNIGKLAKISLISLVCVLFLLVVIIARAATLSPHIPATPDAWTFSHSGILSSIGIMVFAFMCHHNSFLLYDSLYNATQSRWNMVTHLSVLVSAIVTLVFGVIGYVIFTGYTEGDILENFCRHDDLINVTRLIFTFTIMLTYPIECFVCREVVERIFFPYNTYSVKRHTLITILLVALAMMFSFTTDCLGIVLEINGVIAAVPLAFILPALCFIKLDRKYGFSAINVTPSQPSSSLIKGTDTYYNDDDENNMNENVRNSELVGGTTNSQKDSSAKNYPLMSSAPSENGRRAHRELTWAWIILILGLLIFGLGLISIISHLHKGVNCSHGRDLFYCAKTVKRGRVPVKVIAVAHVNDHSGVHLPVVSSLPIQTFVQSNAKLQIKPHPLVSMIGPSPLKQNNYPILNVPNDGLLGDTNDIIEYTALSDYADDDLLPLTQQQQGPFYKYQYS